ncbi:MAG: zf-TFIIB domain-containing protein [Parcubacteria group bacterium]
MEKKNCRHRLVLAEFLIWLAKIYTLAASYDKFLNVRQLEIQKCTSQCAGIWFDYQEVEYFACSIYL